MNPLEQELKNAKDYIEILECALKSEKQISADLWQQVQIMTKMSMDYIQLTGDLIRSSAGRLVI